MNLEDACFMSQGFQKVSGKELGRQPIIYTTDMCIRVCNAHPMKSLQANSLICPISESLDAGLMSWFHYSSERSGKLPPLMEYMLGILPITEPLQVGYQVKEDLWLVSMLNMMKIT